MSGTKIIAGSGRRAGKATAYKEARKSGRELDAALRVLRLCLSGREKMYGLTVGEEALLAEVNRVIAGGNYD